MKKINAGIIGMGYIGVSHLEAIRRIGFANIVAVADYNYALAKRKAEEYSIEKCYQTIDELLNDPEITIVHNCTPNNIHTEINKKILKAGKHLFSEKPLATSSEETAEILALKNANPELVAAVNFNYRMNPLVQEIRNKIKTEEIGVPYLVHGSYLQDWLLYDTDYNWRIDPEISGPSRCIADIGSHWMDMVQHVLNSKITEVCADLVTVLPVRKKPTAQVETFSHNNSEGSFEEKTITTEDYGAVLFKMDNGIHGVFHVSEVSAGRGCFFNIEVNGSKSSVYWNQERCDEMWMGFREEDNRWILRNPNHISEGAKGYTYLAKGHPEGWNDAFKNNIYSVYRYISEGKTLTSDKPDFATLEEATYILKLTEAILESSKTRAWVAVK